MGEEKDLQIDVIVKHNLTYAWQMETVEGEVLDQYSPDGKENSWKTLDVEKVVRASLISRNPFLPSHDILIDLPAGERFVKRFGRGFIQPYTGKNEYVNCIMTNRYRAWIFGSTGKVMITRNDFELYINL